jgi:hypothetical protein
MTASSPLRVTNPRIRKELQLAGLRFMCTRARWLESEATVIGLALKSGELTSGEVDAKLEEMGALDLVYPELMTWYFTDDRPTIVNPRAGKSAKPNGATYRTPQSVVDAFLYVARNHDPEYLARWLADHPRDIATLNKLWEAKNGGT